MDRRTFLGAACSAAAWPMATPVVLASAPGERRLVVIVLRGGLDGIGMVQPYGDPAFAKLRPTIAETDKLNDLDGFYGLASAFSDLLPMWHAGDLGFVSAVSTPYRSKRSHFGGQDVLENGGGHADGQLTESGDGWLNRALALIPGARAETAMAVGQEHMLLLHGSRPVGTWSPRNSLDLEDDERRLLSRMYENDPLFSQALAGANMFSDSGAGRRETATTLAEFAAKRLNGPARIAAFSVGGWDTHRRQGRVITRPARALAAALAALKSGLGKNWEQTAVLAVTEFGRTARENGSGGTDHGTGGMMIVAGGAVAGGKVHGTWPGLGEGRLFEDRDLMPADDIRRWAAWMLAGQFGLDRSSLEKTVFPGVDLGVNPGILR